MAEFIIYTDASVDSDGNTVVTPEVIARLTQDMQEKHAADENDAYIEGNFGLTVKYADLKALIELAGHSVKEVTLNALPKPTFQAKNTWDQEEAVENDAEEG